MRLLQLRKLMAVKWRQRAEIRAAAPETGPIEIAAPEPELATPAVGWSPLRLEVVESLWGEGNLEPGATDEVLRLAKPLSLTAASSLLLLGEGSGGAAARLAGEFGVWVTACETDPTLLAIGTKRLQRSGAVLAKRAVLQAWDPAAPAFRRNGFNHAIALEALGGPRPAALLLELTHAIRPGGHLVLVETVATTALDAADPAVAAWCRLERREVPRVGTDWVTRPLEKFGYDLRVAEDVTAEHARQAVLGWKNQVRAFRRNRPPPRLAAAIVAEAELWLRRIQLLRSGKLRVMRMHAISSPAGPPRDYARQTATA